MYYTYDCIQCRAVVVCTECRLMSRRWGWASSLPRRTRKRGLTGQDEARHDGAAGPRGVAHTQPPQKGSNTATTTAAAATTTTTTRQRCAWRTPWRTWSELRQQRPRSRRRARGASGASRPSPSTRARHSALRYRSCGEFFGNLAIFPALTLRLHRHLKIP